MSADLIGHTFCYNSRGECVTRKVIAFLRLRGEPVYELLDPDTHKHYKAYVSLFNRIFKAHRTPVKRRGSKGKNILGKQKITD